MIKKIWENFKDFFSDSTNSVENKSVSQEINKDEINPLTNKLELIFEERTEQVGGLDNKLVEKVSGIQKQLDSNIQAVIDEKVAMNAELDRFKEAMRAELEVAKADFQRQLQAEIQAGMVTINQNLEQTQQMLEKTKQDLDATQQQLEKTQQELRAMSDRLAALYCKDWHMVDINGDNVHILGRLAVDGGISCGGQIGLKSCHGTYLGVTPGSYPNGGIVYATKDLKGYEKFTLEMACSREFKENISHLSAEDAIVTLSSLNPVKYDYKGEKLFRQNLGFIAEELPDNLASADRKSLSPFEIIPVLTKVVQYQQQTIAAIQSELTS